MCAMPGAVNPGAISLFRRMPPTRLAPLQQRDVPAGLRQVRRGDQAVVAAADDDHAFRRHHATCFPPRFFSFRYSSAAMRPGAPMMPPPGCVAEPHIQRSWTGVR